MELNISHKPRKPTGKMSSRMLSNDIARWIQSRNKNMDSSFTGNQTREEKESSILRMINSKKDIPETSSQASSNGLDTRESSFRYKKSHFLSARRETRNRFQTSPFSAPRVKAKQSKRFHC